MTAVEAAFYDALLENPESAFLMPDGQGPYANLHRAAADLVSVGARVVEFGCGTGRFAKILRDHRHPASYLGLDFSEAMIEEACKHTKMRAGFRLADLRDCEIPDADVYVALEVLEHLDDDLGLLGRLPSGARIVMSLPDFASESHVRHFPTFSDVTERYARVVDFDHTDTIELRNGACFYLLSGVLQ